MVAIYFFYGLAFFILAGVIFGMPKKLTLPGISDHLWLFGVFALTHGINEWIGLFIYRGAPFDVHLLRIIEGVVLPVSFIFIGLFAWHVITSREGPRWWLVLISAICLPLWALASVFKGELVSMNIAARYFIALPGTLLAGLGLYLDFINRDRSERPRIISFFELVAIIALVIYGLLAGLVVPKADFLLAGLINQEIFSQLFGLPVQFFRMLCAIVLTVSIYVCMGVFYHERGKLIFKGGIRRKAILFSSMGTCVVVAIGIVIGYLRGVSLLQDVIGNEHKEIAIKIGSSVSNMLDAEINVIETYLTETVLMNAIKEANLRYANMSPEDTRKFLMDMDRKWINASVNNPTISSYLDSPASRRLNKISKCDDIIGEIFITDKLGGLAVSSGRTSDFYQADEDWWQSAYYSGKGRVCMGDIEYDESSKTWAMPVGIPVRNDNDELIGICKAVLGIDRLFSSLAMVQIGHTGQAILLNGEGRILFQKGVIPYAAKFLGAGEVERILNSEKSWAVDVRTINGRTVRYLVALKALELPCSCNIKAKWIAAVSIDLDEVYSPIRELFIQMLIISVMLVLVLLPIEFILGKMFVRPITELQSVVERIVAGEKECVINIKTGDEVEWLGESFMAMVRKVNDEHAKLLSQIEYSQGIIASMSDVLIVVNPDSTIRLINKTGLDLLGYREDELIGHPAKKIFRQEEEEEEEEALKKYFQKIIDEGAAYNIGLVFLTKEGNQIPINFSGALLKQSGKVTGIIGVARDMRRIMAIVGDLQRKDKELEVRSESLSRMQRAILHIMNDLREASRARAQFTGMVSHELRTPLAAIKEGVAVVLDKIVGEINQEQEKYLEIAKKNVDRLERLITGVLDFQKLEAGKMEFVMQDSDVNEIVNEVHNSMLPLFKKKGLDFELKPSPILPSVRLDRDKIIQVLINLLNNAFKFTEKGGVTITTGKADDFIRVEIKDTGIGIKEEDSRRLFQEFTQLERKVGGTGLGLVICKKIIDAHKGNIWADSEPGKGTSFYFTLPI